MKWCLIALATALLLCFPSLLPALLTLLVALVTQPPVTVFVLGLLAGLLAARTLLGWSR
ncbi:hypothetical protein [Streptomyces sp. LNU-CPARS28]|uniref:hypothetical protein n=1 Tax=Streptomyces sp. LNU-CPARS28 TaxID=3137371 RepID=UPI003134972C